MKYIIFPFYIILVSLILTITSKENLPVAFLTCEIILTPLFGLAYLITFIIIVFKKNFQAAFPYMLTFISFIAIPWKTTFMYYNFLLYCIIVAMNIFYLYRQKKQDFKLAYNYTLIPLTLLLIALFAIGNENYFKLRYADSNSWKPYGLTLNDFTKVKEIPNGDGTNARVNTNYARIFNKAYNYPNILIVSYQYPEQSYFIVYDDKHNNKVLDHEQLHFDIKELYARKIKSSINSIWYADSKVKQKLFDSLYSEEKRVQALYDTLQSQSPDRQAEQKKWNQKIRSELGI